MGFLDCKAPEVGDSTCEGCKFGGGGVQQPRKLRIFKFKELERATNFFSEKNVLGKGSHSCVYKAVLSDGEVVAVKRPTFARRTLQDVISFDNELDILSRLRHRHLVNLIGFCNEAHEKLLVVEFMENGTLFDLLHSSGEPLSWSARLDMALQAAKAVLVLHSATPPIIHRDVKSSNILIDSHWNAKLSDLGLALRGQLDDVARQGTPPAGTMGYIDPEYQTPAQLSSKSDVFSFGILLLEMMSGRKAIDVRHNPSSLMDWAVPLIREGNALDVCDKAIKPPQNIKVVDHLAAIAARSVRQSKDRRPTMVEVVEGLRSIRRKLPDPRCGGGKVRNHISPLAVAVPKREDVREGSLRTNISPTPVLKDEVREDSGNGVSFSKSEEFSIFDEDSVSGEGMFSPSDAEQSLFSPSPQVYVSRGSRSGDGDGDSQAKITTSQALSASKRASSKPESPIFGLHCSPTIVSSPSRVDIIRNFAASPLSPLSTPPGKSLETNTLVDRNTPRRLVESSVFGSTESLRTSITSREFSAQDADSRLKWNQNNALGVQLALEISTSCRTSSLERNLNSSKRDVQLGSQNSVLERSKRQSLPKRNKNTRGTQVSSHLKVQGLQQNGATTQGSRVEGRANRDAKVDSNAGSTLQTTVSFRVDVLPNWGLGLPATAAKCYPNTEPSFEKLPTSMG